MKNTETMGTTQGAETKTPTTNRNVSMPFSYIEEMVKDEKLLEITKRLLNEEPGIKVGMLMIIAKRERRQLELNV